MTTIPVRTLPLQNECAVHDILYVLRDKKMFINEKKMWLNAIDLLHTLGYYKGSGNDNEKASLFGELR